MINFHFKLLLKICDSSVAEYFSPGFCTIVHFFVATILSREIGAASSQASNLQSPRIFSP
jgi:hypothetical protein